VLQHHANAPRTYSTEELCRYRLSSPVGWNAV